MPIDHDTDMGGSGGRFPTTHWTKLAAVHGGLTEAHRSVLNLLIQRYWKPVYCYIRRRGYANEDAKDMVQEFFASWLAKDLFGRADPARGRFRSLLLSSLDNFLKNVHRAQHAKHRGPPGGLASLEELMQDKGVACEPSDEETPQAAFDRVWVSELLMRVLKAFEQECHTTGKDAHYELFLQRIIKPALEGVEPPPLSELARRLSLTEKQAANCLLTARRAYQRLLREEIRTFASSEEDLTAEIQDLFRFLSAG